MRDQVSIATKANNKLVELRELEREAESYKVLYQAFLQRYQQTVQQQSFPISDARIVSAAAVPLQPSAPNSGLALAMAAVLGAMAGGAFGAFREYRDRAFRTAKQIRDELNLECLGVLPQIENSGGQSRDLRQTGSGQAEVIAPALLRYVLDAPYSEFAETLRGAVLATDLLQPGRSAKMIGVVSAVPGEGKTITAKNLATLLAVNGSKTLLVDADLRSPSLTRTLMPNADAGLIEVLTEERALDEVARVERSSGLVILPAVHRPEIAHSSHLMASSQMDAFLDKVAEDFDYVILDLPPLGPVVDARAVASKLDGFIFVVKWGRTSRRITRSTLEGNEPVQSRCIGAILNSVDLGMLRSYEGEYVDRQSYSQYLYHVAPGVQPALPSEGAIRYGRRTWPSPRSVPALPPRLRQMLRKFRRSEPPSRTGTP